MRRKPATEHDGEETSRKLANATQARSLGELLRGTARQKTAAARARASGTSPADEAPRDVYAAACATIAARIVPHGFRWAKSGAHLTRKAGDMVYRVAFSTSHHNVAGQQVKFGFFANVSSPRFGKWRAGDRALRSDSWIAGGMFHLLRGERMPIAWNLANLATRAAIIDEVASTIETEVLPYFALFADPAALVARLTEMAVPALEPRDAIELALCFGNQDAAERVLTRWLLEGGNLQGATRQAYERFRALPELPAHVSGYAEEVAHSCVRHGLRIAADVTRIP